MEDRNHPHSAGQGGGPAAKISQLIGMDIEEYLAADAEAAVARNEWRKDEEARRGLKALMVAPSLTVCRALLSGERVPWNTLVYAALRRYGLRRHPPDGRISLDDINDVPAP